MTSHIYCLQYIHMTESRHVEILWTVGGTCFRQPSAIFLNFEKILRVEYTSTLYILHLIFPLQ